jgi:hypothetical protein
VCAQDRRAFRLDLAGSLEATRRTALATTRHGPDLMAAGRRRLLQRRTGRFRVVSRRCKRGWGRPAAELGGECHLGGRGVRVAVERIDCKGYADEDGAAGDPRGDHAECGAAAPARAGRGVHGLLLLGVGFARVPRRCAPHGSRTIGWPVDVLVDGASPDWWTEGRGRRSHCIGKPRRQ